MKKKFKKWAALAVFSVVIFVSGITYAAPVITHADSYNATWVTALTDPQDLLQTNLASTTATGNFNVWNWSPLGAAAFTDGQFYVWPSQFATWESNASVEYYLNTSVNTYGYNITAINTYGGWNDGGRDAQQYSIWYSVVGSADWILYDSVDYNPATPVSPSLSRLAWSVNLQNVDAIKLVAPASAENGSTGLCEIDIIGTLSTQLDITLVDAGTDQNVWLNNGSVNVSLDGTVSGSDSYTMQWSVLSKPIGSTVAFTPPAADVEDPVVQLDMPGTYVFKLAVTDGDLDPSATATVKVHANACFYAQIQSGFEWMDGDINADCEVDMEDLVLMLEHWLDSDLVNYGQVSPSYLRCEYKIDPLGIDVTRPRLSWKVIDPNHIRGQAQTAYQIIVSSSIEKLKSHYGDLWNSGRVNSDQSMNVVYAGNAMASEQACYWKVRIWDKDGNVSPYSSPAKWSMGLLDAKADWDGAKWISYPLPAVNYITSEQQGTGTSYSANWTHAETISFSNVTGSSMTFTFTGSFVQWIGTRGADKGIAEIFIDGVKEQDVDCYSATTQSGQVLFTKQFNIWPGSHTMTIKVKGQKNAASNDFIIDIDSFKYSLASPFLPPASYWRKDFSAVAGKTIKRAMLYTTALGAYEFHINGSRVGEDYFNPGWTQFTTRMNPDARSKPHRVYYHTYDVTSMLSRQNNAIGAILSTGWYAGYIWAGTFNYGTIPELLAKLKIEYDDGTSQNIVSDTSWKLTYNGPIREGDIQQGETYDARMEINGWDKYGYNEIGWSSPQTVIDAGNNNKYGAVIKVQSHLAQPVRKTESREPIAVTDVGGGKYIVKFDQQMSGWIEFRGANGTAGNQIKLQYTSAINPDGTIYTDHLRDMRGQDYYTMDGSGNEGWEPRFTYHGFQYVEVTGWPGVPTISNFTAHLVHTDAPRVHTFESSDPRINKLDTMVEYSIRTNTVDIPAACADRAERLGWMGDRNCFLDTESYYLDTAAFLTKWMQDIVDAQAIGVSGTFHQVSPIWGDIESAGWSEAGMHLPYVMLKFYGDTTLSNKHYSSLYEYASYIDGVLDSNHLRTGYMYHPSENFIGYGDWLAIDQDREGDFPRFNTIQNYASVTKMAEVAAAAGRNADASYYETLATSMKNNFNNAWVNSEGVIVGESQTLYAMAFDNDLIKDDHASVEQVKNQFVHEILNKSHVQAFADALGGHPTIPAGHLTTGFSGSNALLPALSDVGRNDVAYSLLLKDTFPSWLYCIDNGMTTGWERWDSWMPDKGFQSPAMNSFNLPAMHASIGQWLMGYAAGIKPDGYGFKKIQIKPYIGHGLDYIDASYESPYGKISIRWQKNSDGSLDMHVEIPVNTTASIYIPYYYQISESDITVWQNGTYFGNVIGIGGATLEDNFIRFGVESGSYIFKASGHGQEVTVNHAAEEVTYSESGWEHYPNHSYTCTTDSMVSYTFNGTGIKWIGEKVFNRGYADIFIDGVHVTTIDAYSPTRSMNQELFSKIGLMPGQHTISIRCKGQKHPSSSDYYIDVSGFKVIGD